MSVGGGCEDEWTEWTVDRNEIFPGSIRVAWTRSSCLSSLFLRSIRRAATGSHSTRHTPDNATFAPRSTADSTLCSCMQYEKKQPLIAISINTSCGHRARPQSASCTTKRNPQLVRRACREGFSYDTSYNALNGRTLTSHCKCISPVGKLQACAESA